MIKNTKHDQSFAPMPELPPSLVELLFLIPLGLCLLSTHVESTDAEKTTSLDVYAHFVTFLSYLAIIQPELLTSLAELPLLLSFGNLPVVNELKKQCHGIS